MKLGITLDFEGSNVKEARILYKAFGKEISIKYGFNYSRLLEMMVKKVKSVFLTFLIL